MATRASSLLLRRFGRSANRFESSLKRIATPGLAAFSTAAVSPSIGDKASDLAVTWPTRDCIRYEHKNEKFSFEHVQYYSEALAVGFLEYGFLPGDVVLSWLPNHFSEQHILQVACSKAGLVLYSLDPAQAITDPEGAKESLKSALEVTEANALVTQEAGDDVHYVRLVKKVIPETRIFDFDYGMPFLTPRFPHLRIPIHTGFDTRDQKGFFLYRDLLYPSGDLDKRLNLAGAKMPSGSTPLVGQLTKGSKANTWAKGKTLSNDEAVAANVWPEVNSILKKEYIEIEGVGVIF